MGKLGALEQEHIHGAEGARKHQTGKQTDEEFAEAKFKATIIEQSKKKLKVTSVLVRDPRFLLV